MRSFGPGPDQNGRVFSRDGWQCVYCGFDGGTRGTYGLLEADHLDPDTKRKDDLDPSCDFEKVTSCGYCNRLKSNYKPLGADKTEMIEDATREIKSRKEKWDEWFDAFHSQEDGP